MNLVTASVAMTIADIFGVAWNSSGCPLIADSLTDSGSPRSRLIIHTFLLASEVTLLKQENCTAVAVYLHLTNPSSGDDDGGCRFISSPSAAPAPRNSSAQVTSCLLEHPVWTFLYTSTATPAVTRLTSSSTGHCCMVLVLLTPLLW